MWTRINVALHQRTLVLRNGQPHAWLAPGTHRLWTLGAQIECQTIDLSSGFCPITPHMRCVAPQDQFDALHVGPDQVALVRIDGVPSAVLTAGRYALWTDLQPVTAQLIDLQNTILDAPAAFWPLLPTKIAAVRLVKPFERLLVYVDGTLDQVLGAGRYALCTHNRTLSTHLIDVRQQEFQITGQEIITADKASVRINLIVKYRITDPVLSVQATTNLSANLYSEAQMAARTHVGAVSIDDLLESRHACAQQLLVQVRQQAQHWGVEVLRVDIKDIVLPGEMKALLNRVIEAQKQADANLITRRQETAATRSLANTAKLLHSNPTLLRLKELEALKEIAQHIDDVTVVLGQQQLGALMGTSHTKT